MRRIVNTVLVVAVLISVPAPGEAAITPYIQDFESLDQADTSALGNDGWVVYGNVFSPDGGTWYYGYGPFPAPNDGAAFSAIATGEGGPSQGAQQLSVYSDYNNTDHGVGNLIESNVYQEQTIESGDIGKTVVFTFDAKFGTVEGSSEAEAFLKTLDPAAGYATTNHLTEDMTSVPTTWGTYSLQLTIDSGLVGQLLQFGFSNRASNYEGSGVFYDNVGLQDVPPLLTLTKVSSFIPAQHDHDGDGVLSAGDSLLYTITATNDEAASALGVVIDDNPDLNTALVVGTTTTTQGTVVSGNTGGDVSVSVDVGTLASGGSVTIEFVVRLANPLPDGVTDIANQAILNGDNVDTTYSNTTRDAIGAGQQGRPIPSLSTWGVIVFTLLLAGAATWKLRA